jgi:hypothetical protein
MSLSEPQPYSTITVDEVAFTGNTGPVQAEGVPAFAYGPGLDPENFTTGGSLSPIDAFVVGIHAVDPPVGSGDPQSRDSLIGFKILETGEYTDIEVPIFPYRPDIGPAQVFPPTPNGTTTIEGTLWHDVGLDYGATQGVIQIDGSVNASANIMDLDQNPNRGPIGQTPRDQGWNFVGGRGPDTFDGGDNLRFGEAVDTVGDVIAAGAPLEDHSTNVGSTYIINGIYEELEPGVAGISEDQIEDGAQFGSSVAIAGPIIAVGAPNDDGGSGVVYIFVPDGESAPPQLLTKISGDSPGDDLGAAVDVTAAESDGDPSFRVIMGAPNAGTGGEIKLVDILSPEPEDGDPSLEEPFSLSPGGLGQNAEFGSSIETLSLFESEPGSPALIGAPGTASDGTDDVGKAYLYETTDPEGPSPEALTAMSTNANLRFGSDVGLGVDDEDLLLAAGAPGSSDGQGEAALFEYEEFFGESPSLEEPNTFTDSDGSSGDRLGAAVGLTGDQNLVAGAPGGGYATLFNKFFFDNVAGHFTRPGDVPSFGTSVATSSSSQRVAIGAPEADGGGAVFIYETGPGPGLQTVPS